MKLKRILALALSLVMVIAMAGCGNGGNSTDPTAASKEQVINVCLASEPNSLDPALNTSLDGSIMAIHLFAGLSKWDKDGKTILPDLAEELPEGVVNEDGTVTYTYTLKEGLLWSDGQPFTAKDIEFSWKRAADPETAAEYGYMFEVVKGYNEGELAVTALDERTLEVTLYNAVSYWNELLAFPTYMPVREDVVANESWATDPSTYVCNGPYKITSWKHDSLIVLTKNENYHDAANVTMPVINCYLSDDDSNMLANFKNGSWQLIDTLPIDEMESLKAQYGDEFQIIGQLGTYFACWNVNENLLPASSTLEGAEKEAAQSEIRYALGLLLDRNYIVNNLSQAGELPASTFVPMGLTDCDGSEFYKNTGVSDSFTGYFDVDNVEGNYQEALEILKKYYTYDEATGKFTDMPSLTYIYNTTTTHQAIGEYIQNSFENVGMGIQLQNQEWSTFIDTRNSGDFSISRHGWTADYNDPISFLDMWVSFSGNNDAQFGKGEHANLKAYSIDLTPFGYDIVVENGTWAETYDKLISVIKSCTDSETRYKLMHYAEDMIMATGCLTPIYYYTDVFMIDDSVKNFFTNPLGYKYFMYTTVE
ncbi:MAG: ABC transporter substrate-binding protein [Clostridia bacterium]